MIGCGDPCLQLSRDICRCERTEFEQQACIQRVEAAALDVDLSAGQEDCCADLRDSCTCDRLAAGDLAACGLAQEEEAERQETGQRPPSQSQMRPGERDGIVRGERHGPFGPR